MADRMNQGGVAEQQRGRQESTGGVMGAVAGKAQDLASGVASAAEQAWESTSEGTQYAASAVAHGAEEAWDSVRGCMSRYSFATFFTGVGIGVLFMMAMQRR
jgi:hypothetical protein